MRKQPVWRIKQTVLQSFCKMSKEISKEGGFVDNKEAKEKIFSMLISCEISTYTAMYAPDRAVVPISNILAFVNGLTKYRARKALKELISDGVICYTSQGCPAIVSYGEYKELIADAAPPINGYCLTKKGFETVEWKQAYKQWKKSMEEWANG